MAGDSVLLVHGLWFGRLAMLPLARRLASDDLSPERFGWPTTRGDFLRTADRLAERAGALDAKRLHLVGHSLGGVLVLKMLERAGERLPPGRVVLLGSPVRGSAIARRMAANRGLARLLGSARPALTAGFPHAPPDRETGIIAGSAGLGAGRLLGRLDSPHDGTVAVAETDLPGAAERIVLPVSHSGLLLSMRVADAVSAFLHRGRFNDAEPDSN